jgi:hypothetical protein
VGEAQLEATLPRTHPIHKKNNPHSAYTMHIINNRHEYGPMHNTMELLKTDQQNKNSI